MDQLTDWNIPNTDVIKGDDLDQYLEGYNEDIDELFNETLIRIQDLDVPTGFVNDLQNDNQTHFTNLSQSNNSISHQASNSMNFYNGNRHSRKISGTAIFGFENHTRELSIELNPSNINLQNINDSSNNTPNNKINYDKFIDKSISPVQLLRSIQSQNLSPQKLSEIREDNNLSPTKKQKLPNNESKSTKLDSNSSPSKSKKLNDYIITNSNPKSYKFPPSPKPADSPINVKSNSNSPRHLNNYSAKYLQELGRLNSGNKTPIFVDDIEPLLEENKDSQSTPYQQLNYVPIPVNEPTREKPARSPQSIRSQIIDQQIQQQIHNLQSQPQVESQQQLQGSSGTRVSNQNFNTYLPPPTPPPLSHNSPDQSSPEPRSFVGSPNNLNSSPIQNNQNNEALFYNPQFFSDDNNFFSQTDYSSPISKSLSSSPIKNQYYSNLRQVPISNTADFDETVDADNTIAQLTPLKSSQPITPSRNKVILEWSPIVSPNAKNNKDVRQAIKQSSAKKRIKKTSLLPPGELDKYWEGPDEDKIFTCIYKECGKKFTRRYNVRSHIQTHLSDRPFSCAYCPKKFVRQHDLNRHVKGHLESRPCKCPCGKEFKRIDAMKQHRLRNVCSGGIKNDDHDNDNDGDNENDNDNENQIETKHDNYFNEISHHPQRQLLINSQQILQNMALQNYDYSSPVKYSNSLTANILDEVNQLTDFN